MYSVDEGDSYISVCAIVSTCIEVYMPNITIATGDIDAMGKYVKFVCTSMFTFLIVYAIQLVQTMMQ